MGARLAFPPFTFDLEERVLRRGGAVVPLPPKAADALTLLLAAPGMLVSKERLRDALWPEGFVEDGNLTQTIYMIRRALDPGGDGRAFVETIPRRGYRFVPAVETVAAIGAQPRSPIRFALRSLAAAAVIAFAFGGVSGGNVAVREPAPLSAEAARAYAVGRFTWSRRTEAGMRASIGHFGRVIALAPGDARGYAGLADTYAEIGDWGFTAIAPTTVAYRRAEALARDALRRDPHSGEAYSALATVALQRDGDLARSEADLRAAMAYKPDHGPAYELLGILRLDRGDADGASRALRRATELDPLSPMNLVWYGKSLYYAKRFDEAHTALRQLSDLDALNFGAVEIIALTDLELGLRDEARATLAKFVFPPQKHDFSAMLTAFVETRSGRRPRTLPDLRPRAGHIDVITAAALCLALGRRDDALSWLAFGMRDRETRNARGLIQLDPRLASLRGDARFQALLDRAG
jgi:DNA-binding winged helix-turn-helix (wHTH) protein/tetratricopeptide (TPR) repeat protein